MRLDLIQCRFQDAKGAWQDTRFVLREDWKARRFQDGLAKKCSSHYGTEKSLAHLHRHDPILPAWKSVGLKTKAIFSLNRRGRFHKTTPLIILVFMLHLDVIGSRFFLDIKQHQTLPWWYDLPPWPYRS